MLLTLDSHLDSLFYDGLTTLRENEDEIIREWGKMDKHFQKTRKRSATTITKAIDLFSRTLFTFLDKEILLNQLKVDWDIEMNNQPINQSILSTIESSVHHAINTGNEYKDLQAIQYVFNEIGERILGDKKESSFTYDLFLRNLVHSQQLPIDWVAILMKEGNVYKVSKWFHKEKCLLTSLNQIESDTVYGLTEKFLEHVPYNKTKNILTVPFEDQHLLLCTDMNDTINITPFINHSLQLVQSGKSALTFTRREQQWKDPVMMFNESIIRARTFNDVLNTITEGFVNYLPFERCAIFSYSKTDEVAFGLSAHQLDSEAIKAITEDIKKLPLIHNGVKFSHMFGKALKYLQPLYIPDANIELPDEYIESFHLKSIVVTPIYTSSSSRLLGAAVLDQGANKEFTISQDIHTALIKFGQSAGEVLDKFHSSIHEMNQVVHFSPREIEVLHLMAEGESTTSAAESMHLSEYTVRDYITSIMQKMKARNRTEAVARAIRKGVI